MGDSQIINFSEMVEANGKTVRENNLAKGHKYPLGTLVNVDIDVDEVGMGDETIVVMKGRCRLFVVGHSRDCDGTPLYILSDLPIEYPVFSKAFDRDVSLFKAIARIVERNRSEESLSPAGYKAELYKSMQEWLKF